MNARHSKKSVRWGTPLEWVQRAREALGGRIELDPMSEPRFNDIVDADRICTKRDNGLEQPWICDTMLINPAGGLVVEAWRKLVAEYEAGNVRRAVWIGFSVEQLCVLANDYLHPDDFSKLTVRSRIDFITPRLKPGRRPSHGNYIVGLGVAVARFEAAFSGLGRFHHGRLAVHADRADRGQERSEAA